MIAAVGSVAAVAWWQLWENAASPGSFLGGDLQAYTAAAQRLASNGTPYSIQVLTGPIANTVANVPVGYFYSPILAQIFIPFAETSHRSIAPVWIAAQIAAALLVFPRLLPRQDSQQLLTILMITGSFPFQMALFGGNVSGWIAIAVGWLLTGPARTATVSSVTAIIKLTPAPLLAIAVADRTTRKEAVLTCLGIGGLSIALAPKAWADWITALPNIVRNEMAMASSNYSPAHVLVDLGLSGFSGIVEVGIASSFCIWALYLAVQHGGRSAQAISAAAGSLTFASTTLWDHYLAVLVPLTLFAWPRVNPARRLLIWAMTIVFSGMWLGFGALFLYRAVVAACSVALFALVASSEASPHGRPYGRYEEKVDGLPATAPASQ